MLTPPSLPKGWRIIATDDNTSKLSALTETPRAAGHCEFAAYDGESALEQLSLLPAVDLLVTNTRLGAVDGPELMQRARAIHPDLPTLSPTWERPGRCDTAGTAHPATAVHRGPTPLGRRKALG